MYTLEKVVRRASRIPSDIAYRISSVPVVNSRLDASYQQAIAEHEVKLPTLMNADDAIASSLRNRGVAITTLYKLGLGNTEDMFTGALAIADGYERRAAAGAKVFKDPHLVVAAAAERFQQPDIFRWGLNERLLNIVENYLGLPPAYNGVNLFYTLADGQQRGSRVWHKDGEDRRVVKVAVYLNEVDLEGGPFEVLHTKFPGSDSPSAPALTDKMLARLVGRPSSEADISTCLGPAGTVIFCDTARFYHRGRPATQRNRSALFYTYFASPPRNPFYCEASAFSQSQLDELTRGLNEYQKESANWRQQVRGLGRLISPH